EVFFRENAALARVWGGCPAFQSAGAGRGSNLPTHMSDLAKQPGFALAARSHGLRPSLGPPDGLRSPSARCAKLAARCASADFVDLLAWGACSGSAGVLAPRWATLLPPGPDSGGGG